MDANQVSEELGLAEELPKSTPKANVRRIKSKANRLKTMNRWANAVTEAGHVLGRPVIVPGNEPVTQPGLSSGDSGRSKDSYEMGEEIEKEVADHSSDGRPLPEDSVPQTPSAERPITPPPLEAEANIEGEQPTTRSREPPTPQVEEKAEGRPTVPQDNEVETEAVELVDSEAFRNNTENRQSSQP